jgi:hypothetical protein
MLLLTQAERISRMVSKNRSSVQVEPLEGRRMMSVTPAAGAEYGAFASSTAAALKASGSNLGAICSVEKGQCAADSLVFLHPPGQV